MLCPKCNSNLPENAKFCDTCGNNLGKSSSSQINILICPKCNTQNDNSSIFCEKCGFKLNEKYQNPPRQRNFDTLKDKFDEKQVRQFVHKSSEGAKKVNKFIQDNISDYNKSFKFFVIVSSIIVVILCFIPLFGYVISGHDSDISKSVIIPIITLITLLFVHILNGYASFISVILINCKYPNPENRLNESLKMGSCIAIGSSGVFYTIFIALFILGTIFGFFQGLFHLDNITVSQLFGLPINFVSEIIGLIISGIGFLIINIIINTASAVFAAAVAGCAQQK